MAIVDDADDESESVAMRGQRKKRDDTMHGACRCRYVEEDVARKVKRAEQAGQSRAKQLKRAQINRGINLRSTRDEI